MLFSYFFRCRHVTVCGSRCAGPGNGSSEYLGVNALFCYFCIKSKIIDFRGAGVWGIEGGKSIVGANHRNRMFPKDWVRMSIPFMFSVGQKPGWVPCTIQADDFVAIGRLGNASFATSPRRPVHQISSTFFSFSPLCLVLFVLSSMTCSVIGYVGSDSIRKFSVTSANQTSSPCFPLPTRESVIR